MIWDLRRKSNLIEKRKTYWEEVDQVCLEENIEPYSRNKLESGIGEWGYWNPNYDWRMNREQEGIWILKDERRGDMLENIIGR